MKSIKEFIKIYKIPIILAVLMIAISLTWNFMNSYSEDANDSAWDGVMARTFTSGTGTEVNPYVISNASEYAYFKNLLEGEDASAYVDKNYIIRNGFNYGEYDFSINNEVPFSGSIDGEGNLLYNLTITNNWFNSLDGAVIKNINFDEVEYSLTNETGALLANDVNEINVEMFIFNGDVNVSNGTSFGGLIYETKDSEYNNIVLNYEVTTESENINTFANSLDKDTGSNILIKTSDYKPFGSDTDIEVNTFDIKDNEISLIDVKTMDGYETDDYKVTIIEGKFIIEDVIPEVEEPPVETPTIRGGAKGPVATDTITEHASGASGNTFYINDLTADLNYLTGLNYTEIRSTSLPSGTSTGYYDASNLVKVEIIYDGADINVSSRVGALSPIGESTNKFIYFKYYPLERTSSGALAIDANGDNYIHIELIDNPFSKRPYVNSVEYGFNGWVCNQNTDTTSGLCGSSTFRFDEETYTRYLDIPVSGGSELVIHLNASWHKADVVTSYGDISDFNNMSMQFAGDVYYTTELAYYNYRWNATYYTMNYVDTYSRYDTMPAGYYYNTNSTSTNYTYMASNRTCNNRRCYVYEAVNNEITQGMLYTGGTVTFVPNYSPNRNLSTATLYSYNANYMDKVYEDGGMYSEQAQIPHFTTMLTDGMNTTGYYYKINNPSSDLISQGKIYNEDGVLCTNSCNPGYKLIQYNDEVNNTNGNSIYLAETVNGDIVDSDRYYYLVTRDTNIFRYTSTTRLNVSNIQVNRPFTVTGTTVNGTSTSGVLSLNGGAFTPSNDVVIENIQIYGPNSQGTRNIAPGDDSKNANVIYANSHNLKIGRNVTSSRGSNYLVAESVLGGTNSSLSGTFKVIVESGKYYAFHSGVMSGSTSYTFNETAILGNDYDRILTANNSKLKFLIGLDGFSGGRNTAGSDSLFAAYTVFKSGLYGYNDDGTPNNDTTAGMYIGGYNGLIVNSLTGVKIEGGNITYATGGYGYNGGETTNATYIGMSGGTIRSIYGGAGYSTTKGNRIINVTGGTVSYSILGGSDSYSSNSTTDGVVNGSTLIYVGGTAHVGGGTNTVQGVEAGNVFGAGGGNSNSTQKGTVRNSHIIINGATIDSGVYGGGNYGSTGTQYNNTSTTVIDILSGNIGNVFGGSKAAGFSQNNYRDSSTIDINMSGGTVGYIYGGSDSSGTAYGSVSIDVSGGTVTNNIYGGGKGASTIVTNDVNVTIGASGVANTPTIGGSVYGGSALGTVNSTSNNGTAYGDTSVTVHNGTIAGSVFGGGQGDASNTAYVLGNATVSVDGGTIANIYGGSDYSGRVSGNATVTVAAGSVTNNIYGGGKGANTFVRGNADVTIGTSGVPNTPTVGGSVYGGSALGTVNSTSISGPAYGNTSVTVHNGTVTGSVYGGGQGDTSNAAYVLGNTTVSVDGGTIANVYGGSDYAGTVSGNSTVTVAAGSVTTNIYGGGKGVSTFIRGNVDVTIGASGVPNTPTVGGSVYGGSALGTVNGISTTGTAYGNTTVTVNNGVVTGSVFGGGQGSTTQTPYVLGDINVTVNGGDISKVFGGHDQAGSHTKTNEVHLNGGIVGEAFGGGNKSSVTTTHVYLNGSTVTSLYGGSNTSGDVTTANVAVTSGTAQTIYGGNNEGGSCTTTNVNVQGTATINGAIYGGGNQVNTTTTNVTLTSAGSTIPNVYGGGNSASVGTSNITKTGTTVTNLFGGSNSSGSVTNSYINHNGGTTTTIYGGNNAGGNTITSHVNMHSGTATTIYGGGNSANGSTSNVIMDGGTVTTIFGGGNSAGLDESHVTVSGGTITDIYGGSNTTGKVDETNITFSTVTGANAIYGGGNRAEVGDTNVTINSGSVGNVYGGGNLAQATGNTMVDVNGGTINTNLYGGGNFGVVKGNSNVTITNATILGSAYAGGNGVSANLEGDTNITVDGTTVIGTASSTAPDSGCVFGGGNQALTGTQANNNSTSTVNIVAGTIHGNVYGGANTSVVYGDTVVNIGKSSVSSNYVAGPIDISGHIFGGGEANASGSEIYDWSFISVTNGAVITIDADGYNSFNVDGSFYGGGNASTASGDSYLYIKNYGSHSNPERNISIQRVTYVTIDNSSLVLEGAVDRANDYDKELFSISRVVDFKLQNNSYLFMVRGANWVQNFQSLDASGNPAVVTIANHQITQRTVDNRLYMYEGRNMNIAKDQQNTDYGEVVGMTFFGIFNFATGDVNTGIYSDQYAPGDSLASAGMFAKGSYVSGKHETNHDITLKGFYSNFMNETSKLNEVDYINPTPEDSPFYMWSVGVNLIEYDVNLVASKYSTMGSVEFQFLDFTRPNTSFQIESFDISDITPGVSLIDKASIPRIAATTNDANTKFGLAMEAGQSGWLTSGKTLFYTFSPYMAGTTYYEGENSTAAPSMLFYLYHSKNITEEVDLGTVRITIKSITQISPIASEIDGMVINVNMSTAVFQTTDYEAAMTPGDKYELFTSTSTNITTKSKLSAYYGLYGPGNLYHTGDYRVLASSYVLPVGTKITMLDFLQGNPEYYYHVITASDYASAVAEFNVQGEASYPLSLFTRMGSMNSNTNYDDAAKNAIYFDGTDSSEEFIFIVDFGDTQIDEDHLNNSLLIEIRDANDNTITTVLGTQQSKMLYNLYYGKDSQIDATITPSVNPLYIGYSDVFDTLINYQASTLSGTAIIDTQYLDNKMGVQIYLEDANGNIVSGTDLTGAYFLMDEKRFYPDIGGYTHIKLSDKVGNARKWITFNTENASLATGSYKFHFEIFGSPDGIYYSSGDTDHELLNINVINSTYGLDPQINDDTVVFSGVNNTKNLQFSIRYTSLLSNPNIRLEVFRRQYDEVYDTGYDSFDIQTFVTNTLTATSNPNEYMISTNPAANNNYTLQFGNTLLTGTYRLVFKLYDDDTEIGSIVRYIIVK